MAFTKRTTSRSKWSLLVVRNSDYFMNHTLAAVVASLDSCPASINRISTYSAISRGYGRPGTFTGKR